MAGTDVGGGNFYEGMRTRCFIKMMNVT